MVNIIDVLESTLFETIYSEYISFYNKEERVKSAYNIFNYLFEKFNCIFNNDWNQLNDELEASSSLNMMLGICSRLDDFIEDSLNNLDTNSDINCILKNIQNSVVKQNILVVDFICKHIIFNVNRFLYSTEQSIKKATQASLSIYKNKFYDIQIKKMFYQHDCKTIFLYSKLQKQTKNNLDILYKNNLICKDISTVIYQYLV